MIPIACEVVISGFLARPFLARLRHDEGAPPTVGELFRFTVPLSVGGFFLTVASIILGAIIARSPRPELMLPAYYLAAGLAQPMAFASSRIQATMLAFPSTPEIRRRLHLFSWCAGMVLGCIPLLFILPALADWYYLGLQKCSVDQLGLVRVSALLLAGYPVTVAFRSFKEGFAAGMKRPVTILAGQGAFLGILTTMGIVMLALKLPGNSIAPIALIVANLGAALIVHVSLSWESKGELPVFAGGDERV